MPTWRCMKPLSLSLLAIFIYLQTFTSNVDGIITVAPQNILTAVGQQVTFNCTTSLTFDKITWNQGSTTVAPNCQVIKTKNGSISVTNGAQNCDMTINSVTLSDADTITCQDADSKTAAMLVVLKQSSCGLPSNNVVTRGSTITIPCQFDYRQYGLAQAFDSKVSTYTSWSSSSGVVYTSASTAAVAEGSIVSSLTYTATGTVVPSFTCTGMFTFGPGADISFTYAQNSLSASACVTSPVNIQYCSTNVTITPAPPANGQVLSGTTFTCISDTNPTPSYTWTATGVTISTTGPTTTVTSGGPFTLTCVATSTLANSQTCTANATISGTSIVCPSSSSITISDVTANVKLSLTTTSVTLNDVLSCTTSSYPAPTSYNWYLDGQLATQTQQTYTLTQSGVHGVTCNPQFNGTTLCDNNAFNTVSVRVVACPTSVTITSTPAGQWIVGQTSLQCSSSNGFPSPTYAWYNGPTQVQTGSVYNITTPGNYVLTCVAMTTDGVKQCSANTTVSQTANDQTTTTTPGPTTTPTAAATTPAAAASTTSSAAATSAAAGAATSPTAGAPSTQASVTSAQQQSQNSASPAAGTTPAGGPTAATTTSNAGGNTPTSSASNSVPPASGPTSPPTGPTSPPLGPTSPSSGPTSPPTGPTSPPSGPTSPPTGPTSPPSGPTSPPTGPTSPPSGPTSPPSGPTSPPSGPASPPSGPTTVSNNVNSSVTTGNGTNPSNIITAIVVPSVLGALLLALAAGYCCWTSLPLADDNTTDFVEEPLPEPPASKRNQLPLNTETSYYAPGYATNQGGF